MIMLPIKKHKTKKTLTGWWFQPTPLKNDGVKVSWDELPNMMGKIKAMFQTTNQIAFLYGHSNWSINFQVESISVTAGDPTIFLVTFPVIGVLIHQTNRGTLFLFPNKHQSIKIIKSWNFLMAPLSPAQFFQRLRFFSGTWTCAPSATASHGCKVLV